MMMKRMQWERIELILKNPFTVSYGTSATRTAFWLRLAGDEGWGEGTIPFYYGIDFQDMTDFWDDCASRSEPFPDKVDEIQRWIGTAAPSPAIAAVDIAFHDRIGKQQGMPLYKLYNLPAPEPRVTSYTLSIDTPEAMAAMAEQVRACPYIKIKLGAPGQEALDEERLRSIRAVRPDAKIRLDANAGWRAEDAVSLIRRLEKFDLELIEQPTAKEDIEGMGDVQRATDIPIVADESVRTLEDIDRIHQAGVRGVNLKLMKCGGIAPAIAMIERARSYGMQVMLGCMVETSVGVGAMSHLMGIADWVDLDTPLLIANDPFSGLTYTENATVIAPTGFGLGLHLQNNEQEISDFNG